MVLLMTAPTRGQDPQPTPTTFEDLRGVVVQVEPTPPALHEAGMTAAVFSAEVERRLKLAGVPVFQPDDHRLAPGFPALYLQVNAIFDDFSKQCTWSIRVELNQFVRMERDPNTNAVAASTWSVGGLGFQIKDWRQGLVDDVLSYVDQFIEAFAQSNPEGIEP
jgi:hypothetical protein